MIQPLVKEILQHSETWFAHKITDTISVCSFCILSVSCQTSLRCCLDSGWCIKLALNHCLLLLFVLTDQSVLTDLQLDMKYAASPFKNAGNSVHIFTLEFIPKEDRLVKALNLFLYYLLHLHRSNILQINLELLCDLVRFCH